jgi:hypothetical protein
MNQKDFPENMIKGRLAETVFELMFREGTEFDIYPLGYEHSIPILYQFRDHPKYKEHRSLIDKLINNFNDTPDFLIVKSDKSRVYAVEVKYQAQYNQEEIMRIAEKVNQKWDLAWFFLATNGGFFFDPINNVLNHKNQISPLSPTWIPAELQEKYLKLIQVYDK